MSVLWHNLTIISVSTSMQLRLVEVFYPYTKVNIAKYYIQNSGVLENETTLPDFIYRLSSLLKSDVIETTFSNPPDWFSDYYFLLKTSRSVFVIISDHSISNSRSYIPYIAYFICHFACFSHTFLLF